MWIRSWIAGLVFAMLTASSVASELMHSIVGKSETYLFGSVVDSIAPSALSASGVDQVMQLVLISAVVGVLAFVGAIAWPLAERALVRAADVLWRLSMRPR
jgi:hypothetical protein